MSHHWHSQRYFVFQLLFVFLFHKYQIACVNESEFLCGLRLVVTLLNECEKLNRQTNDKTTQRFGKIKRAASQPTKPMQCNTFAFALMQIHHKQF